MMKKSVACVLLAAMVLLMFTACADEANRVLDTSKLADDLLAGVVFGDELAELPDTYIGRYYRFDSAQTAEIIIYVSTTSATAEEFAIVTAADIGQVDSIKEVLQKRVNDQIAVYESYSPTEVKKLNDAKIFSSGKYVILVVADDTSGVKQIFTDAK